MSDEFRRQRKALMITTSLLALLRFLNPSLLKMTILGIQLQFPHVSKLYVVLWVFMLYTLIRYYQYYRHDGLAYLRDGWKNSFSSSVSNKLSELALPKIDEDPRLPEAIQAAGEEERSRYDQNRLKADVAKASREPQNLKSSKFLWYEFHSGVLIGNERIVVKLPKRQLIAAKSKLICHFLRNRPQSIDVVFPFLYTLSVAIYCNWGCWDGSIAKMIDLVSCD